MKLEKLKESDLVYEEFVSIGSKNIIQEAIIYVAECQNELHE